MTAPSTKHKNAVQRSLLLLFVLPAVMAWVVDPRTSTAQKMSMTRLAMGLYGKPLPPRPAPREEPEEKGDPKDEPYPVQHLFEFNVDGTEKRNLLPRLSRTLSSGIDCYFETSDRLVQNLAGKTDCHPKDAAWALEACKGDITEAWTCISTARRNLLDENPVGSLKAEVSELMADNDYKAFKEELKEVERQERIKDYMKGGDPDDAWLPIQNPKPVDDEPWFTG